MFCTGDKIKYFGTEAIILTCWGNEVLIFVEDGYVKWVDKSIVEYSLRAKSA